MAIYTYFCIRIYFMKIKQLILRFFLPAILIVVVFLIASCKKDVLITDTTAKLKFSADTILFDTVFTTIGSTTMQLKVYNPYSNKIKISSIKLAGGTNSSFRMNVDGVAATEVDDVELAAKDSIFIFVKVTIDPNNSNSPMVVSDSILFMTNGNQQQVQLVAWGQDAYYHTPNLPAGHPWYDSIACNSVWVNDKPHVIYGYAIVETGCMLTIKEGTRVYMHKNSVLAVDSNGSLRIEGTMGNTVTFQGDRLEQYYKDKPGQWGKIWLYKALNCEINYAVIKNGYLGIHVDSVGTNSTQPALKIENTIIENMGAAGILAQGSWVEAKNCVIGNCSQYAVVLNIGGRYDFRHCTIGNYWSYSTRVTPSLVLNNWYKDVHNNINPRPLTKAYFGNCIIYGSVEEEILRDSLAGVQFNYKFDHCLLKTKMSTGSPSRFINCLVNSDPAFADVSNNDYELSTGSAAIDKGSISIASYIPFDILRHNRTNDIAPDLGAYEKK
jgi:hypothetical protein